MQHPGRVSFKFINKMQLVSGSLLGTGEQKGTGTRAGWCMGQGGSAGLPSPVPLCGRLPRRDPSCLARRLSSPSLGRLWDHRKVFCGSVPQFPPGRAGGVLLLLPIQ